MIKTISKNKIKDKKYLARRELEIMKLLDHPNIIKFHEAYISPVNLHYVIESCKVKNFFISIKLFYFSINLF